MLGELKLPNFILDILCLFASVFREGPFGWSSRASFSHAQWLVPSVIFVYASLFKANYIEVMFTHSVAGVLRQN